MGRAHGPQVISGLQAAQPGQLVDLVELLARRAGQVDVQALGLVYPFLAPRRRLDQPLRIDLESRGVELLDVIGHAVDAAQAAVEMFQVHHHHIVPKAQTLQVANQVLVDDRELTRQVALDRQVAEARFDRCVDADDVADRRGGRDGHAIAVAHAVGRDASPQRVPVHRCRTVDLDIAATCCAEQVERVDRQDATVPQRAAVTGITATLLGQFGAGPVGVIADRLHRSVGELDRRVRCIGHTQLVERILETHQTQPHRAMPQVAVAGLLDGIEVDVDDVVEHPHRCAHRLLELDLVDHLAFRAIHQVLRQVDRTQVADRDLGVAGVERDLGAQVAGVHHADMLLRRAHVAGVLEGHPRVAGLEQHRQHLAPQVLGRHALVQLDLAAIGLFFIGDIGALEIGTELVVQVGAVRR